MNQIVILAILSLVVTGGAKAQDPETLVRAGRVFLAAQDLDAARTKFIGAVSINPNHEAANVLLALTDLARIASDPQSQSFLDRLGVTSEGRNIYHWVAKPPNDTNGVLIVPGGFNVNEIAGFYRMKLLPAMTSAAARLAKVTNSGFLLTLTRRETSLATVTLDYGDILMLRSMLHGLEYVGYTASSWNLDLPLTAVRDLATNHMLTAERLCANFPQLFTFANTGELLAAQSAFQNAADRYLDASMSLRSRSANLVRLFNLDPEEALSEERFRRTVADLRASLNGPVMLTVETNYTVYLSNHFSGANSLRLLLPRFSSNSIIAGSLPDPSLGGVIRGLSANSFEYLLSRRLGMVSELSGNQAPGIFSFDFGMVTGRVYAVECSTNLQDWITLLELRATNRLYQYAEPLNPTTAGRYYRLSDLSSYFVSVEGKVIDLCSGLPVSGAVVREDIDGRATTADGTGRFVLQTHIPVDRFNELFLEASASGYSPESSFVFADPLVRTDFYLVPAAVVAPPNDQFDDRIMMTGLPASTSGSTCGAISEAADPDPSVWWSWISPVTAQVCVGADQFPLVSIYTGTALGNLSLVTSDYGGVCFQAIAGTTYSVQVSSFPGSESAFRLNIHGPPIVTFFLPTEGVVFSSPALVELSANAIATAATIQSVTFYQNGRFLRTLTDPPFTYLWEHVPPGDYFLEAVVQDSAGNIGNDVRSITVLLGNDNFTDREIIVGDEVLVFGSNERATAEPDEPAHAGMDAMSSAWWTWTPSTSGFVSILAQGISRSSYNAAFLGVYTGDTLSELAIVASNAFGGAIGNTAGSQVSFFASAGTPYQIAVDGEYDQGDLLLQINRSRPPTVSIVSPANDARVLQPFTIVASAIDPDGSPLRLDFYLDSKWQTSLRQEPYYLVLSNLTAGYHWVSAEAVDDQGLAGVSDFAEFIISPVNDFFADRSMLSGTSFAWNGTTLGTTNEPGEPDHGGMPASHSAWWHWTAPFTGLVRVSGYSDAMHALTVYTGTTLLSLVAESVYDQSEPFFVDLAFVAAAGSTYAFAIDGDEGDFYWDFSLRIAAPIITSQPTSQAVAPGTNVAFRVAAFGLGPISYQWQFNNVNLPDATSSNLLLTNVTSMQAGSYRAVVDNSAGSATSQIAILTVTVPFTLANALDAPGLTWATGGTAGWVAQTAITHDGIDAARSSTIGNSQESWIQTIVTGPGTLTFWWRVSSESGYDFLAFLHNGIQQTSISGEIGWQQRSFSIPSGAQTLRWRYYKDGSAAAGQDRGWLDQIVFTP